MSNSEKLNKIAFIFPGQGAQYPGMGKELAESYEVAMKVFDEASKALGTDIKALCFNGSEEDLKMTENTQPTILTVSVAIAKILLEKGIKPDYTAGLSLGEYSSHVISESISFDDAVKLVRKRGRFMQEAVPVGEGTMAAIMGLDRDQVLEGLKEASSSGIIEPANYNCPGQIVISGETEAVEKACEILKGMGAKRAILLPVSAPFHSSMLAPAGDKLAKELETVTVYDMKIPVITNVNANIISNKDEIKSNLIRQVSSSVLWEDSVKKMLDLGVKTFIEIGPGKALSGFVKKIDKEIAVLNVEDLASLAKTLEALGVKQ